MPQVETRYGQLAVPDTCTDLIGRFLLRYGEWAQEEILFVASALRKPTPRVCDIGAFVGTFGIGLSQARSLGALVLVEPNPLVAPLLRINAALAHGVSPNVVEAAVSGGELAQPTYNPDNMGSLSFTGAVGEGRTEMQVSVEAVSLGSLRRDFGPFDLIKIDAEGLETAILADDAENLRTADCAYWIECNESPDSLEICRLLLEAGLRVQYFAFPAFSRDNFLQSPDPIFPYAYEAGLWASHDAPVSLDAALADRGCLLLTLHTVEDLRKALWQTPRFGLPGWDGQPAPVIAALAGREIRGERWEDFMTHPPLPPASVAALRDRIHELESDLLAALQRTEEADALRARLARAQAAADTLVADAQDRALRSEDLQRAAEARLVMLQADLAAITSSTAWRAARALRSRLAAYPSLVRALKAVLRPAVRVARAILRPGAR